MTGAGEGRMRSDGGWRRVRGVVGWVGKRLVSLNGEGGIAREGDIRSDKHVGRIGREGCSEQARPGTDKQGRRDRANGTETDEAEEGECKVRS